MVVISPSTCIYTVRHHLFEPGLEPWTLGWHTSSKSIVLQTDCQSVCSTGVPAKGPGFESRFEKILSPSSELRIIIEPRKCFQKKRHDGSSKLFHNSIIYVSNVSYKYQPCSHINDWLYKLTWAKPRNRLGDIRVRVDI